MHVDRKFKPYVITDTMAMKRSTDRRQAL